MEEQTTLGHYGIYQIGEMCSLCVMCMWINNPFNQEVIILLCVTDWSLFGMCVQFNFSR